MSRPRIAFMGTPEFAVATLAALLHHDFPVVGVITAPDKPAGRGRKLRPSAVKVFAEEKGLQILQPKNLKKKEFLEKLKSLNADLQVVVAFRMLPKAVWDMPRLGTINLHASLLPDYRGAAPINWAIMNGETASGITTFYINDKIDTGAILLQEAAPIMPEDAAGDLHDRLMVKGAQLVVKTLEGIADGSLSAKEQDESRSIHKAPKLNKENCRIDWSLPEEAVFNHIRGLSPYPGAWTILVNEGKETPVKIFSSRRVPGEHERKAGALDHSEHALYAYAQNGYLELLEIQLPGKRRMQVSQLIHGLRLNKDAHLM